MSTAERASDPLGVDDVLITGELARRPSRPPDHEAENRALSALVQEMAANPGGVLQKLAELVLDLCRADSAGVSVLEPGGEDGILRWHAAAGAFAPHLHDTMPREASPCGTVIARDRVLLFDRAERSFPALRGVEPPIRENLLAPLHVGGEAVGTLWAIKHTPEGRFDAEDARLLASLARFASAALEAAEAGRRELERRVEERTRALAEARLAADLAGMRRLHELHAKLAGETDLTAAVDAILAAAVDLAGTDRGTVQLLREGGGNLEIVAAHGYGHSSAFIEHFRHEGFEEGCDAAKRDRKRLVIEDTRTFPGLAGTRAGEVTLADGILAAQSTPMVTRKGEMVGVLSTQYRRPYRPSEHELRMLDLLAWIAAEFVERHHTEAVLRRREERLRRVLETDTVGVLFFDRGGTVVDANDAFLRMTGHTRAEVEARALTWRRMTPPEWVEASEEQLERLAATGRLGPYEKEYFRADGSRRWMLFAGRDLGDGTISEYCIDVTDRKRAEAALRESEERLRQFGEASSDVLWVRDAATLRFEYVSPAFETVYGVPLAEVMRGDTLRLWARLIHPEDRKRALDDMRRVRRGERVDHEHRVVRPSDGRVRWVRDTDFPLLDVAGRVQRVGGIGQDVTEAKEAQERQRRLTRELDHRVKNVLALVQALASQTLLASGSLDAFADAFEGRLGALARAHGLLTSTGWEGADLRGLAEETLAPYLDGAGPAADGPPVALPPRRAVALAMVLHELATNAAKYGALSVPAGRVEVGWDDDGGRRVRLVWREAGGPEVRAPEHRGFGTALIEQSIAADLGGSGGLRFEPEGLVCELAFPLD